MTSLVPKIGELDASGLPRLVGRLACAGTTGSLVVHHDGGLSRAYFRGGRPAGATVFGHFKPLGVFLMERGIIDIEALDRSLSEVARTRRPQGEILVELGAISPEALEEGLRGQQAANLMNLLAVEAGTFELEEGEPPPWTEDIQLDAVAVLRALFEREDQIGRVETLLGALGDAPHRCRLPAGVLDSDAEARALLEAWNAPQRAADVIAGATMPAGRAGALVAAAWCLGWVEAEGTADAPPAQAAAPRAGATAPPDDAADPSAPTVEMPAVPAPSGRAGVPPGASPSEPGSASPPPERPASPDVKARRSRLLRQAFRNIPGAEKLGSAQAETPPPGGEPAREATPSRPKRSRPGTALGPEAEAMMRELAATKGRITGDDYYERLGIDRRASLAEVKAAYLSLVKRYHPDRVAALSLPDEAADDLHAVFEAVQEAYDTLRDPKRRETYDGLLADVRIQGDRTKAKKIAESEIAFKKGEGLFRKKDWAGAMKYFEKVREADRTNGRCEVLHAWARYNVGPKEKVEESVTSALGRATSMPGGKALGHYYLGILARMREELGKAERHFRQAVEHDPEHVEALTELRAVRRRMEKENTTTTKRLFRKMLGGKD